MTEWISEPLSTEHDLSSFDCGQPSLDEWLRSTALRAQTANVTRTYVWTGDGRKVVAYYSVAPTQVSREELSGSVAGGFSVVPAYLLARLALDRSLQGQGLGAELLVDALGVIVEASGLGGGRLIVVDAIDDGAAAFYRRHDFRPVKGDDKRLVMKVSTARQALDLGSVRIASSSETQLISLTFELPDGSTLPVVMSVAESDAVLERLEAAINQQSGTGTVSVSLREVLTDALGRDPFATST